ncbi:MAG TPA: tRNA (adenosine(37)-N6)-dimethylallyltransferase MiaA [Methylomirabilota bacterium]|jgi:tRNA dimethylallyltransferase|nr:tRNA (adenosine(37)-N6)-dimethylallyltransferase MiaA [Methylomirabilota bacterium]
MVKTPPLLVIVGPTGVGKTAVAVRLGQRLPMEIVSADSRQVYRGMDIGTGKPTPAQRAAVSHHLLDLIRPDERYHAARFRRDALEAITSIESRGKLAVVVGGTGLYVRALLKGLDAAPPADPALRSSLESLAGKQGSGALHARLASLDPPAAARLHPNDRVRLIRALEKHASGGGSKVSRGESWGRRTSPWRILEIGLTRERHTLNQSLKVRVEGMVADGMMDEVRRLLAAGYDAGSPGMNGIGYRQFVAVLREQLDEAEAVRLMVRDTQRYAKRQMTWFRRDAETHWLDVDRAGGIEGTAEAIGKLFTREGWIE